MKKQSNKQKTRQNKRKQKQKKRHSVMSHSKAFKIDRVSLKYSIVCT